jgi:cobalt/nickel transport system permease protein
MHFHLTDAYEDTGSAVHRMDARLKLVATILLILFIGLSPVGVFGVYAGFYALNVLIALSARIDPWMVIRRSLLAIPFALAAVTLVFTVPGPSLGRVPLLGWPVSEPGLIRCASILLKSVASVQIAVILMLTTQFTDTLWALSALRVPRILIAIVSFMYRYLFLLADESIRLTRARDSRSAVIGGDSQIGRSLFFRAQTTGRMIGNLVLRSFERSERVYQAMVSRGYRGEIHQLTPPSISARDWGLFGIVAVLGMMLAIIGAVIV